MENSFQEEVYMEETAGDEEIVSNIPVKRLEGAFDDIADEPEENIDGIVSQNCEEATVVTDSSDTVQKKTMRVFLRVRPLVKESESSTVRAFTDTTFTTVAPTTSNRAKYTKTEQRSYEFNKVFGPDQNQEMVFTGIVAPLLNRFLSGDSCVTFAYGMTNSGKTHTIQGVKNDPGILPRLVDSVLEHFSGTESWELSISMMEVYQENIYDLLGRKREKLKIRDVNGRVDVNNLSSHPLGSAAEAVKLMDKAAKARSKSRTLLNTGSSRSHAIYTLSLSQIIQGREVNSLFQVVDLAGAERMTRTKASSTQLKEANVINTTLMQLWRCLHAMSRKNDDLIPFRESKLTHLLMPTFGRAGLEGVAMVACINPGADDYDETISILSNASIACKIQEICDLETRAEAQKAAAAMERRSRKRAAAELAQAQQILMMQQRPKQQKRTSSLVSDVTMDTALIRQAAMMPTNAEISTSSGASEAMEEMSARSHDQQQLLDEAERTIAALRQDVAMLEDENEAIREEQMQRETEIRIEVSHEMAERGQHLMRRIEELQEELASKDKATLDAAQSVRKARKKVQSGLNAEVAMNLEEVELELIRIRDGYELELAQLRDEKRLLEKEVERLGRELTASRSAPTPVGAVAVVAPSRQSTASTVCVMSVPEDPLPQMQATVSAVVPPHAPSVRTSTASMASLRSSTSTSMSDLREESRAHKSGSKGMISASGGNDAAGALAKRMKRDGRFVKTGGLTKSPMSLKRSPLQMVRNDENSPLAGQPQRSTRAMRSKLPRSTTKTAAEDTGEDSTTTRPYLSRLRSQFASAQ